MTDECSLEHRGSFVFAICRGCDWIGPGRRSTKSATDDAVEHVEKAHGGKKKAAGAVAVVHELAPATDKAKKRSLLRRKAKKG